MLNLPERGERLDSVSASNTGRHRSFFETRGKCIADRTHDALDAFERQLETYTGPQQHDEDSSDNGEVEEPDLTESLTLRTPLDAQQTLRSRKQMPRVQSAPSGARRSAFELRPSSPLSRYDYGSISVRPNSLLAQRINSLGEQAPGSQSRPSSSPGFYSGGPAVKAGYGFSMLEPILMPKEMGFKAPPLRCNNASDYRPPSSVTKVSAQDVIIPKGVRMTVGHARRCMRHHAQLKHQVENEKFEEIQFQNGVFNGRWRDPTIDGPLDDDPPPDKLEWLADAPENQSLIRRKATRILFGLDHLVAKSRVRVTDLFRGFDNDGSGTLEPHEFHNGLMKLGVVAHDEITEGEILQILKVIDGNFDGHVSLPELTKVLDTVKNVKQIQAARKRRTLARRKLIEQEEEAINDSVKAMNVTDFKESLSKITAQLHKQQQIRQMLLNPM